VRNEVTGIRSLILKLLGTGAYENAEPEAAAMGLNHVLFVTSGLSGTGIIDECKTNFENAGVSVTVYDKVESNPKDYNVMAAYKAFSDGECDGFVSIGGGSSHDTTKGARIVAAHDGRNVNEFQALNTSETLDNPAHLCNRVEVVRSVDQLADVAEELVRSRF
jgi:methanol:N,N-dimethyl-4-nitrosoaniline oxidoreductase